MNDICVTLKTDCATCNN